MHKEKYYIILLLLVFMLNIYGEEAQVIELSWDQVTGTALRDNLSLKISLLDEKSQQNEVKKAWGGFLPEVNYQWVWSDDELTQAQMYYPVDNTFIHTLSMTYPLFTGGARYANLRMQQETSVTLKAELRGAEASVVEQSLQAYYGVILAAAMVDIYQEAQELAEANLRQVESFSAAGTATELTVLQARTRYFETIPQLENARNQHTLAVNQLKMLLNIEQSTELKVLGTLKEQDLLGGYADLTLSEYQQMAKDNRHDVVQITAQRKIVDQQKLLAISQFLPSLALTASRSFYAYSEDFWIESDDFTGYNSVGLAVQMPLFAGGSRWYDYKTAGYAQKKLAILKEITIDKVMLETEQAYYSYLLARDNRKSLQEALEAAEESLRMANLYYKEGLSTQTEVLNAQLAYTQNQAAQLTGIYEYNISQLSLLKAIGDLASIWIK